jgi:hypothetical protein
MQTRYLTDEQLAAVVKTWPTSGLVLVISMHAEVMLHEYGSGWHQMLSIKWRGIERLGKGDIYPLFHAVAQELNTRLPTPTQ